MQTRAVLKHDGYQPPLTLAEYFDRANISQYASWADNILLTLPPREYQISDLNHLARENCSGLFNEPGLGKTLPMQAHLIWLAMLGNKCVALTQPTLIWQFYYAFRQFTGIHAKLKIAIFTGAQKDRDKLLCEWNDNGWPDILVMSYQMFSGKSNKSLKALAKKRLAGNAEAKMRLSDFFSWNYLLERGYTQVTVDEAHLMKKPRHSLFHALSNFVHGNDNGLVLATGSPIENTLLDGYVPIALLTPWVYGSPQSYEHIHCIYADNGKLIDFANTDFAYHNLYRRGRRVLKSEVLNLPPKVISEIPIELSPEHQALYRKLVRERVMEVNGELIDATTASNLWIKSQQILMVPHQFSEHPPKHHAIIEALKGILSSMCPRKLVIYAWYLDSIDFLVEQLAEFNPLTITGSVTGLARERAKTRFIDDPKHRVICVQLRAGGVGIDGWQKVCHDVAFAELSTNPGMWHQAISRLDRSGQTEMVNVHVLVALRTISVRLRNDLVRKDWQQNLALRDKRTLLAELMGDEGLQGVLK